ncbi:hypothetical protein AMPC_28500 [Anaeromyxobacter paludicola]|uniref:Uncharacterized protein n=2 Tax=Anaeromyxobacter paludicola TaxID=2918171 RepID=A0ABN6N918_9BACT|nr:hypothetical protein AMPC_28500 [Anaeromyxobacter paludicola]
MRLALGLVLFLALLPPTAAHAKRAVPKKVPPVIQAGVRYVFPHFTDDDGTWIKSGLVQARDEKTNALLWSIQLYEVWLNPRMEGDVQDVAINSARIEGDRLIVTNERNHTYAVDLVRRTAVEVLTWPHPPSCVQR